MEEVNPAMFLIEAIGSNFLDAGIDETLSGPIMSSLFGDQNSDILNEIALLGQELQTLATEILINTDNVSCLNSMASIETQWAVLIGGSSPKMPPGIRLTDFLANIVTESQIFTDSELIRTTVSTAAINIISILGKTAPNYIQLFFNNNVLNQTLYGSKAIDENDNAGGIQIFAAFLNPYTISVLQACLILEVLSAQGNTNALSDESTIKLSLSSLASVTIPPIAGNILQLLRYDVGGNMLQGLCVFNSANNAAITLNSNNTLSPNNYSVGENNLWNIYNSASNGLYLAPYNYGQGDSYNSSICMVYPAPGSCDPNYSGCFSGSWQEGNTGNMPEVDQIQIKGVLQTTSPITNEQNYYLEFRIGAIGTSFIRYTEGGPVTVNDESNTYYMDNFYHENNFLRASYGKSQSELYWFLEAPGGMVGDKVQVNITSFQGSLTNTATCLNTPAILQIGQGIISPNNQYVFTLQVNGLYVYQVDGTPPSDASPIFTGTVLYCAAINCGVNACFVGQNDGNAVVYSDGPDSAVLWAANGGCLSANSLYVQNDGNVVLYDNSTNPPTAVWNTQTDQT